MPVLNLACELSNLPLAQALASWRHNTLTSGGYWVRHLWFLIVLLYCCSAAAALAWWRPSLRVATLPPRVDGWVGVAAFAGADGAVASDLLGDVCDVLGVVPTGAT